MHSIQGFRSDDPNLGKKLIKAGVKLNFKADNFRSEKNHELVEGGKPLALKSKIGKKTVETKQLKKGEE